MPRTFAQFKARTRRVVVFPDDPDLLAVDYRVEAVDEGWRRPRREVQAQSRTRTRALADLGRRRDETPDDDPARLELELEYERAGLAHQDQTAEEVADLLVSLVAGW